jgi:hypothetical protein
VQLLEIRLIEKPADHVRRDLHGLLHARPKASLVGADRSLEFVSAHQLDQESADRWEDLN